MKDGERMRDRSDLEQGLNKSEGASLLPGGYLGQEDTTLLIHSRQTVTADPSLSLCFRVLSLASRLMLMLGPSVRFKTLYTIIRTGKLPTKILLNTQT